MKKIWDLVVGVIDFGKRLFTGTGNVAQSVVEGTVASVGGRKAFFALLAMAYVALCFAWLKMPTELILAGIGPLLAFIGVEGARDIVETKKS